MVIGGCVAVVGGGVVGKVIGAVAGTCALIKSADKNMR